MTDEELCRLRFTLSRTLAMLRIYMRYMGRARRMLERARWSIFEYEAMTNKGRLMEYGDKLFDVEKMPRNKEGKVSEVITDLDAMHYEVIKSFFKRIDKKMKTEKSGGGHES